MKGPHLTHRRAQRFADLVDAPSGSAAASSDLDRELLELVSTLRAVPAPQPRAAFTADLRAQLVELARTELAPAAPDGAPDVAAPTAPRRRPRDRRVAVALGAVAIVGASSSMAVASQGTAPGDTLYPIKRVVEDAHARLSLSDRSRGTVLLHNAGDRLEETRQLTDDQDADPGDVDATLQAFGDQLERGADLLMSDYRDRGERSSIDVLRRFDVASMRSLTELEQRIPAESEPALLAAAKTLFTVDAAAGQLCATCSDAGITVLPPTLVSSTTRDPVEADDGGASVDPLAPSSGTSASAHPKASARPTRRPTSRPSSTTSTPTSQPTIQPTVPPTTAPTTQPTGQASPTGVVPTRIPPTHRPTHRPSHLPTRLPTARPSNLPSLLPSVLPTIGAAVSSLATSLGQLLGGR